MSADARRVIVKRIWWVTPFHPFWVFRVFPPAMVFYALAFIFCAFRIFAFLVAIACPFFHSFPCGAGTKPEVYSSIEIAGVEGVLILK